MSNPSLPEELLDHVVDFLHDQNDALKSCCLVSKSWVPRARKHLFASVFIRTSPKLRCWKKTFPNPSGSPSFYTKQLSIDCFRDVAAADGEEGGWIPSFSRVTHFEITVFWAHVFSLVPFHGFSPILETLQIDFNPISSSRVFNLVLSFPLLRNVAVMASYGSPNNAEALDDEYLAPIQPHPLNPPAFTGYLELSIPSGIGPIASRFLSMPGCLHFRELHLVLDQSDDVSWTTALVESCFSTLESLYLVCPPISGMFTGSICLSKATKLKNVTFVSRGLPRLIVSALKTITLDHQNLQQITVFPAEILRNMDIDPHHLETPSAGWLEVDSAFIKLWESHSIRPSVEYYLPQSVDAERARKFVETLFPETTKSGVIDLSEGRCLRV